MIVLALALAAAGLALLLEEDEGLDGPTSGAASGGADPALPPKVSFDERSQEGGRNDAADPLVAEPETTPGANSDSGLGSEASDSRAAGKIRGRVEDPDGAPIYMAQVHTTSTDAQGEFVLQGLPENGQLSVSARGFASRVVPLGRRPDGPVKIVLVPARELRILVVAAESGLPLEGAQARIQMGGKRIQRHTDKRGEIVLTVGTDSVTADVWIKERVSAVWHDEDHPTLGLELGRGVRGRVLRPDGGPAPDAPVVIVGKSQRRWPQSAKADAEGRFELPSGIRAGEEIAVFAWDQNSATPLSWDWLPAGSDDVQVELEPRGGLVIVGRGGPKNGTPLLPRQTSGQGVGANDVRPEPWTGYLQFEQLAAGRYRMWGLDDRGYGESFEVLPGQTTHVRWRADRENPGRVVQRVRGQPEASTPAKREPQPKRDPAEATRPSGPRTTLRAVVEPRQPVSIRLRRDGKTVQRAESEDGALRLEGLPHGEYTLELKRRDGQVFEVALELPHGDEELRIPIAD